MQMVICQSVDSTNVEAQRQWLRVNSSPDLEAAPLAVVATTQTAGRGRSGRSWQSPCGGLWLSVAWPMRRPPDDYLPLPLVAGLAAINALQTCCHLRASIKWPNDLLVDDKKIAGILCQAYPQERHPFIVVGLGINANFSPTELESSLRQPATTIQHELQHAIDLVRLRTQLLELLGRHLAILEQGDFATTLLPQIRAHLAWIGKAVRCVIEATGPLAEGILTGVDASGRVIIRTATGPQALSGGELRRV